MPAAEAGTLPAIDRISRVLPAIPLSDKPEGGRCLYGAFLAPGIGIVGEHHLEVVQTKSLAKNTASVNSPAAF